MHAYLLIGNTDIGDFAKSQNISLIAQYPIDNIANVRNLKKALRYSPSAKTIYHLTGIEQAKAEAQNALLKLLEEPPSNTILLLTSSGVSHILPTILSRVEVIRSISQTHFETKVVGFLEISKINDRNEAIAYALSVAKTTSNLHLKETAYLVCDALQKNGNVQLQLTKLALASLD